MHYSFDFELDPRSICRSCSSGIAVTLAAHRRRRACSASRSGIACAWARTHGPRWLRPVVGTYVELIRNTPFIVQLFFIFFGLPSPRRAAVAR